MQWPCAVLEQAGPDIAYVEEEGPEDPADIEHTCRAVACDTYLDGVVDAPAVGG